MMPAECRVYKAKSPVPANGMGDFFGGLRSGGIQFPQVVMNQGPLPGAGGLPQPLHETPDARINYGSSLLGNLTPYAYGEPGYLSSQNAYLNIPHKIQKIVPVVYLPEAKNPSKDLVDLSHPIDDGDLAFVLRMDRKSMFCTGLANSSMRRAGLGTAIDPLINLCTLNYILSGMQPGISGNDTSNLWLELLDNLNHSRFGRQGESGRDYEKKPIDLNDIIHVIRHCIRPFGITRGSEKQGGQDESTLSPATWPVSFVVSLTIDGKESNVLNIWHYHDLSAGEDLVLRLKLMPIRQYTLNHYYKGVKRQAWDVRGLPNRVSGRTHVWQLVPDVLTLETLDDKQQQQEISILQSLPECLTRVSIFETKPLDGGSMYQNILYQNSGSMWQELGFWHIGRSQVLSRKYGHEEFWHNDLANLLRTNHLDITFQPVFQKFPVSAGSRRNFQAVELTASVAPPAAARHWEPMLSLERLGSAVARSEPSIRDEEKKVPRALSMQQEEGSSGAPAEPVEAARTVEDEEEPDWLARLDFTGDGVAGGTDSQAVEAVPLIVVEEPPAKRTNTGKTGKGRGKAVIGGSLLKADGTSEPSMVGML